MSIYLWCIVEDCKNAQEEEVVIVGKVLWSPALGEAKGEVLNADEEEGDTEALWRWIWKSRLC